MTMLNELNNTLSEKDNSLAILNKEKDNLSNLVRLNRYEIENLEKDKTNLTSQFLQLQEEDYKHKNELQDLKLKLLQYETEMKDVDKKLSLNKFDIDNLEEEKSILNEQCMKLQHDEIINNNELKTTQEKLLESKDEIEDLKKKNNSYKENIDELEKKSISTIDHLNNYVNKDYYNSLNEKYMSLQREFSRRESSISSLYQEINSLSNDSMDSMEKGSDEYIGLIKMKFKMLDNEMNLLKLENEKLKTKKVAEAEAPVPVTYERSYSSEELQLKRNLGL